MIQEIYWKSAAWNTEAALFISLCILKPVTSIQNLINNRGGNQTQSGTASRVDKRWQISRSYFPDIQIPRGKATDMLGAAERSIWQQNMQCFRESSREFHHQQCISWYDCFLWVCRADVGCIRYCFKSFYSLGIESCCSFLLYFLQNSTNF